MALGINAVIGSGIFLLPGKAAGVMGPSAILALLLAGAFSLLVALCFAEVGGRFSGTGGAYLYATEAFGPFAGFQVGWISWVVRVISWAALANGVAVATAAVWRGLDAGDQGTLGLVAAALLVGLGVANYLGARIGAAVINTLTVVKLLPIVLFLGVGLFVADYSRFVPFAPDGYAGLGEATLLVLWAFAGFENVAVVAGETKDPHRAVPQALMLVMGSVLVLYLAVFAVAQGTHPSLPGADAPVVDAAATFLGPLGAGFIGVGIAVSVFGTTAGTALIVPRFLYAMAERSQLPAVFAQVHHRFRTPVAGIALSTVLSVALAVSGSFKTLVVISVVARFAQFVPTCLAVLVLRARDRRVGRRPEGFRIPGGAVVPIVAIALCLALMVQAPARELGFGLLAMLSGLPVYLLVQLSPRLREGSPRRS